MAAGNRMQASSYVLFCGLLVCWLAQELAQCRNLGQPTNLMNGGELQQQQQAANGNNRAKLAQLSAAGQQPFKYQQPTVMTQNPNLNQNQNQNQNFRQQQQQHAHAGNPLGARPQLSRLPVLGQHAAPRVGHQSASSICHIPEHLAASSKCTSDSQQTEFNRTSLAEFQSKLEESSQDIRHLLVSYREELRTLSLDLVLVAKNNTLSRIQQQQQQQQPQQAKWPSFAERRLLLESNWRLYDAMYAHLLAYEPAPAPALADPEPAAGELSSEINAYFRRLYLIQVKRLLEQRAATAAAGAHHHHTLDLDCLAGYLQSQRQLEQVLGELLGAEQASSANHLLAVEQLARDEAHLTLSIRQSLEFARTLLSSLNLAIDMFQSLTHQAAEWMGHGQCHRALARMTVCQQCLPAPHQQQLAGAASGLLELQPQQVGPCENYCLNVVRGCINDVYELNSFWAQHVAALDKFKLKMIQTNNIENVMSSLDENLVNFMGKLQKQYAPASTSSASNHSSAGEQHASGLLSSASSVSTKVTKQCLHQTHQQGTFRSGSAQMGQARPAALVLPPTQPAVFGQAERYGHMALRARLSPTYSLFNRLDGFLHRLAASRDFFTEWPERLCQRIRRGQEQPHRVRQASIGSPLGSLAAAAATKTGPLALGKAECWNGRDYSGYSKPLVEFGKPLTSAHPEVPVNHPVAVSPMVLNFVARLKNIGARIAKKSSEISQLSLFEASASEPSPAATELPGLAMARADRLQSGAQPEEAASGPATQQVAAAQFADKAAAGGRDAESLARATVAAAAAAAASSQRADEDKDPLAGLSGGGGGGGGGGAEASELEAADGGANQSALADTAPGSAPAESNETNLDEEEKEDEEEEEEEEEEESEESDVHCTSLDCSDLFETDNPGVPELVVPEAPAESAGEPGETQPPAVILISQAPFAGGREAVLDLGGSRHKLFIPGHAPGAGPFDSTRNRVTYMPADYTTNLYAPPESASSGVSSLAVNLLLGAALGILLGAVVCIRRVISEAASNQI